DLLVEYAQHNERSSARAKGIGTIYLRAGKRCADLVVCSLGIALTSPILILCTCAIKLGSSGPLLFRQQRVGQHGKLFTLLKFRTMTCNPDVNQLKITVAGDPRITRVGKWL